MSNTILYFQANKLEQTDLTDEAVSLVRFALDENVLLAAKKVLESNKFLKKLSIDTTFFEVDESYEGKACSDQIVLDQFGTIKLAFVNDYTNTIYTKSFLVSDGFRAGLDYKYPDVFISKDEDNLYLSCVDLSLEYSDKVNDILSTDRMALMLNRLSLLSNNPSCYFFEENKTDRIYCNFEDEIYKFIDSDHYHSIFELQPDLKMSDINMEKRSRADLNILAEKRNIILAKVTNNLHNERPILNTKAINEAGFEKRNHFPGQVLNK